MTEKDLLENGFTAKNVSRLREVLNRGENTGETLSGLVDDLSKRFLWRRHLSVSYSDSVDCSSCLLSTFTAALLLTCHH